MLNGNAATQWFVYGALYTLAIMLFGIKFIYKYRHNRYQIIRTFGHVLQLGFAFLIPELLHFFTQTRPTCKRFKEYVAAELLLLSRGI